MDGSNKLEVREEFTIEADNLDLARQNLSDLIKSKGLDMIESELCRIEHREEQQSKYFFDVLHYVGPKQQRQRFDPRSV